ncbi:MAG: flagellar biosynthesis anti-sigma factor FlgM [Gammaproteobacteria bacterium]|nr:flagellar biosynthesis anti-sigma factor FlgM [Gammaproteobacteria bacterium]
MGIEISGNGGRPPHEAVEAAKSQASTGNTNSARSGSSAAKTGASGNDQVNLSNQAAQMQALEAQIANLPVVDTRRVQEVQHTLATGSFHVEPARVADKMLSFEAGLGRAQ